MDIVLYVHGRGGNADEAEHYKPLFPSCEVIGLDYISTTPWDAGEEISQTVRRMSTRCKRIYLVANSIGAFFCMNADIGKYIDRATGKKTIDTKAYPNILHAEQNELNDDTYYVVIHDKLKGKHALLIFSPNETTLQKLRPYLSIELKKKFLKLQREEQEYKDKEKTETVAQN